MTVLDEAYQRLSGAWLENQHGFVNHGPMVCAALYTLGLDDQVVAWADRSSRPQREVTGRRAGGGRITEWRSRARLLVGVLGRSVHPRASGPTGSWGT